MSNGDRHRLLALRPVLLLLAIGLAAGGCGTPGKARPSARMEVQEEIGFVITEQARVSNDLRSDYQRALQLLEQGEAAEGIRLLTQTAEAAPLLSAPQIDLGIALRRAGDFDGAEQHLRKALAVNPDHPAAYNELGILYRQTGRFAEARQSYEAALAIYPGFHYARRNLGVLCDLYLADLQCALEQYAAYLAQAPNDGEAEMWLADVENRLGR